MMTTLADPGMHGWLVIDKPSGITSARVVAQIKRATGAKTGHAGTLDPLATGVLALALGEATKTARFAAAGRKRYRFRIRWGVARDTDDGEGEITGESPVRPGIPAIEAALPRFTGTVLQRPPAYSAIKIAGRRAYALARTGRSPEIAPRPVEISELHLTGAPDPDHADFEAVVGEGTYIRSLARDLAETLGTVGHVVELRRLAVGRFTEKQAISLESAIALGHSLAASGHLLPIEAVLDDIPALALTASEAARLRQGQRVTPQDERERERLARINDGAIVGARFDRLLIALARIEDGHLRPVRIINR
ncbi:MAG: tRNA pseudouridine(55) synthase TruB [Alphaproteobacteria bacterium]|nr:tRNA pseudouridine(55) synthase TruB [Alphaproteobacteria bacterium]MBV9150688.1 tRNA pseudouridine(55) synthase TruB [Alphaproteobacteria bacterium]